jgi:glutamate/tyrosine decarboxylase-like PLP-dependent enzyme
MTKLDTLSNLLSDAAERAALYLEGISERRVAPDQAALDRLSKLAGPLPAQSKDAAAVIRLLDDVGSPATVATTGGRYFGFVVGGALPSTVAAHWLADAWDQNACLHDLSPVGAYVEEVVLGWLLDLLELPNSSAGALVTGAQMANFTCLAAARHSILQQAGWDVEADGLHGAPPITIVVSEEVHATVLKALALLGLGTRQQSFRGPTQLGGCE